MIEINNKTRSKIDLNLVKKITERFLESNRLKKKTVSVAFIGDKEMARLNYQYRGKDKPTDILSFEGSDDELGEIVIDYAQIKRQAPEYSRSVNEELAFILVHGLLHLLGYEDDTDEGHGKMMRMGDSFLKRYNNQETIIKK